MVSMNTKKVFCAYKVFQNWYFYIFSLLLIKNLKSKNYLPKVSRNDLIFQIASSSNHMSIMKLRNVRLNNFEKIIVAVLTEIRRKNDLAYYVNFSTADTTFRKSITVCNFQSMKNPWNSIAFYQNSFVISPGCYISWLDATLDDLQTRPWS